MSGGESSGAEERALQIDVGKVEEKKGRAPGEKEEAAWKAGDTVWAKVSGFNYWPAKVFNPNDDLIPEWLQDPPKPNYILVRFFGTYDIEWVSPRSIETYEKGLKKKFHIKSRSKVFQKAVQEVKECLATGVVPEGLTAPPPEPQGEDGKVGRKRQDGSPPRKATVGSKRKSPSTAKQRSSATKRSRKGSDTGKEGESEPPMSLEEAGKKRHDEVTKNPGLGPEAAEDTKNQETSS